MVKKYIINFTWKSPENKKKALFVKMSHLCNPLKHKQLFKLAVGIVCTYLDMLFSFQGLCNSGLGFTCKTYSQTVYYFLNWF